MRVGRTLPPAAAPIGIRAINSGICGIVNGRRELARFESELKEHFGVKHCFLVSSGKAALTLILLALKDLSPDRDEVLIPAFTCYSVPSSIIRAGLKIRLCDLHPDGLDFDFSKLSVMLRKTSPLGEADDSLPEGVTDSLDEASDAPGDSTDLTKRLLAVVPTHLLGVPADVLRLRKLVRDSRVRVVEDAAQAMGEVRDGRKLGTLGDVGFFSLGRGKAFSTIEGGVILTDRDDIAERLTRHVASLPSYSILELLNLFIKAVLLKLFLHPLLFWIPRSIPFLKLGETFFETNFPIRKMSSFQAGLARNQPVRLQKLQDGRRKNVNLWVAALAALGIHRLPFNDRPTPGLIRFPVRVRGVEKRESLLRESALRGLGIMPMYPDSIAHLPELKETIDAQKFPIAERCAKELVTLPTHDYVTRKDVMEISRLLSHTLSDQF